MSSKRQAKVVAVGVYFGPGGQHVFGHDELEKLLNDGWAIASKLDLTPSAGGAAGSVHGLASIVVLRNDIG